MKRNLFQRLVECCVRPVARTMQRVGRPALLLAGGLFASCSNNLTEGGPGKPLAEGEHPVQLTAMVEAATRTTVDDTWDGGEQVTVHAVSDHPKYTSRPDAEYRTYQVAGNGRLTSDDPFWWTSTEETIRLQAWYCGDGSTDAGHDFQCPQYWSVQPDQSGADSYHAGELLITPVVSARFTGESIPLMFYHQTAKVVVNIRASEGEDYNHLIQGLQIGKDNLLHEARFYPPENEGETFGIWDSDRKAGASSIVAHRRTEPARPDYAVTYEALVIPQPTAGKALLGIKTAVGTVYYTAPGDAAPWQAGKVHTYHISVRFGTVLQLEVESVSCDAAWTGHGEDIPVESQGVIGRYEAGDIKIGDYFYDDGTTSDGGVRVRFTDGSYGMASSKPKPELTNPETGMARKVVGIVFQTEPDRIGAAERQAIQEAGGTVHGLVMSVKNVSGVSKAWATDRVDEALPDCPSKDAMYGDVSGYANCLQIRKNYPDATGYPAFSAVEQYNTTCAVAGIHTGWFLPSAGQWWDMMQNLGNCADLYPNAGGTDTKISWTYQTDICAALNSWMEAVDAKSKDVFVIDRSFWTSTEYGINQAWRWKLAVPAGTLLSEISGKGNTYYVRPILAF